MALYGIDRWLDRGEAFSVYFNLFSRISPLERRDGVLGVRAPAVGPPRLEPLPGHRRFVAVMIGSVTFDGFKEGPIFTDWTPDLHGLLRNDLGLSPEALARAGEPARPDSARSWSCSASTGSAPRARRASAAASRRDELARTFVHSLVPIAFVYVAAHYMTQLLFQGQAMAYLASDPLGHGWDLFGGRDSRIDYGVIGATATWYWQVGFVVLGHVAALVLAHDRALVLYEDAKQAVRSQYWMLGVMVGFTSLALWLLSQANQ